MYNLRVFIYSDSGWFDTKAFINIKCPYIPRVGDFFYLSDKHRKKLEKKICSSVEELQYYMKYFYGKSYDIEYAKDLKKENYEDFSTGDAITIASVGYIDGKDFILIELK